MTPAQRQAASLARLLEAGGKRVSLNLSAQAVTDIEALREQGHPTATAAVEHALATTREKRLFGLIRGNRHAGKSP